MIALMCPAAAAAAASAATLHVSVTPTTLPKKRTYEVKLTGSFAKGETAAGRAFLISAIQFSPKPCLATAQAEYKIRPTQFYFGEAGGIFESHSPFTQVNDFTAKIVGRRRICAYLYPKSVVPSDTTRPIVRGQASFRVTAP